MFYDKKIKYLDYVEYGERVCGCGFLKVQVRDEELGMEINVKGVPETITMSGEVFLQTAQEERSLGKLMLDGGRGVFRVQYNQMRSIFATGEYESWCGIRIPLGGGREIRAGWGEIHGSRNHADEVVPEVSASYAVEAVQPIQRAYVAKAVQPAPQAYVAEAVRPAPQGYATEAVQPAPQAYVAEAERPAPQAYVAEVAQPVQRAYVAKAVQPAPQAYVAEVAQPTPQAYAAKIIQQVPGPYLTENLQASPVSSGGGGDKRAANVESVQEVKVEERETAFLQKKEKREGYSEQGELVAREDRRAESSPSSDKVGEQREKKQPRRAQEFHLADEKWQQLATLYPHVHPFRDEREYLSINPADLVLLSEKAYRRSNNSFLLHGFYNYKHLLLGRVERKGELVYYVGTPGNYFEREKQVAIMFGFESFECAEEPAQAGDFGYYMMRVEL